MTICVLCEHDLEKHRIDSTPISSDIKTLAIKCWYEKGQYTDSSFCGCNAGFDDVEVTITTIVRRD